ncbi:hypothetical protein MPSEU_000005700 [Mayamaea pseudoterrestris]|nr:hypothetical protein MPSEU_000005700 [Mayamaea pseudoterrestris]
MPQIQAFAVTDADKNAIDEKRFAALDTHRPDDWMGASDHNRSSSSMRGSFTRKDNSNHGPHSPKKKSLTLAEAREKIAHLAKGDTDIETSDHHHVQHGSHSRMPTAPAMDMESDLDDEDDDGVVEYYSAEEEETEAAMVSDEEEEQAAPSTSAAVSKPITRATATDAAKQPVKRISTFELQMEGMTNKDDENIERVNPNAKAKHSQAPEGYENDGSKPCASADIDLDALQEAPRAPRSKLDPTSRPRTMRGNSFGGTDHVFDEGTLRRGEKKPTAVDKHLQAKVEEGALPASDFSKPIVVDESARPDYAQRPGSVRGKSNIDSDKVANAALGAGSANEGGSSNHGEEGIEAIVASETSLAKADTKKPAKRISSFELQMEGLASKDDENIERVNPNAKAKPSQAPEGYEDEERNPLTAADGLDLDDLPEAPRAPKSLLDPTSRPRTLRGNSFGGTDHVFDEGTIRRGDKKPKAIEKHLQEKMATEESEYSKPITHVDESVRPDYAQRPGVVRGKSGIDEDKLAGVVSNIRTGGKKKSPAVASDDNEISSTGDRPAPPKHSDSNEELPDVRRPSGFGVTLRGTKKGERLLAGEEIAHRVGGIRIVDDDEQ